MIEEEMLESREKPEIWEDCKKFFNLIDKTWEDGVAIAYYPKVYSKYPLSNDMRVHESTHLTQQRLMGVAQWWTKYFEDREFRLKQEVMAYQNQIRFLRKIVKDRNNLNLRCIKLWKDMSSMYGGMCSYEEARILTMK